MLSLALRLLVVWFWWAVDITRPILLKDWQQRQHSSLASTSVAASSLLSACWTCSNVQVIHMFLRRALDWFNHLQMNLFYCRTFFLSGQPANPGSLEKWPLKRSVCVSYFFYSISFVAIIQALLLSWNSWNFKSCPEIYFMSWIFCRCPEIFWAHL